MRKALLIVGILYLVIAVWMFVIFNRLVVLYSEFGTQFPFYTYIFLFGVPIFGIIQIFLSLNKKVSGKVVKIVLIVALVAIPLYFVLETFSFTANLYNLSQ